MHSGKIMAAVRRNALALLALAVYVLALGVSLYELDRGRYDSAKSDIIKRLQDDIYPQLNQDVEDVHNFAISYLQSSQDDPVEFPREELAQALEAIVRRPWSIYRARLMDAEFNTLADAPSAERQREKIKEYNNWGNSLFPRPFSGAMRRSIEPAAAAGEEVKPVGWIEVFWTSPLDEPEIESLTRQYRLYGLAMTLAISAVFFTLYRMAIVPLRRVSASIELSSREQPVLLRRAGSALEHGYNDLARDALLTCLRSEIRDFIAGRTAMEPGELHQNLVADIQRLFGFSFVSIRPLRAAGANSVEFETERRSAVAEGAGKPDSKALGELEQSAARPPEKMGERAISGSPLRFTVHSIGCDRDSRPIGVLVLGVDPGKARYGAAWLSETAARLAEEAGKAVESLRLHQANVFHQRSEASINLAENIGHDLTNIIATSKLDLSTLRQILDQGVQRLVDSSQLRELLGESVDHLLANTRFLQEIVNIYRAFTNLKRPKYEQVDLNKLAREIIELFRSSISANLRIESRFDPNLPACEAEPRLIKLALFNLLSNASDAIKEIQAQDAGAKGVIMVRSEFDKQRHEATLAVRDTGGGIRNEQGKRASAEEIQKIFQQGYSSKTDNVSAGLGLSWVSNIVTEFHNGRLEAHNHKKGGAEFRIVLSLKGSAKPAAAPASEAIK